MQPLDFLLQGAGFSPNYTHIDQKSEGVAGSAFERGDGTFALHLQHHGLLRESRILGPLVVGGS